MIAGWVWKLGLLGAVTPVFPGRFPGRALRPARERRAGQFIAGAGGTRSNAGRLPRSARPPWAALGRPARG
jgi:hypothetical protein